MPEGSSDLIADPSNPNRTTLKILNDKYQDPIKAKGRYNATTKQIEVAITYSKYGINKIMLEDTNELALANTNGIITANTYGITLEPEIYKITIIDKNGTAKRLKERVPLEYGREVLGYECDVPDVKWRLFHADEENIYLIADDYIPYANLPTSTNGTVLNKGNTNYKAYFTNILNDYTGSSWIKENTNEQAQEWMNKYLSLYPNITNANMKAVAYMMDTEGWSTFAGEKAEYAIGGPTLELFCTSYKETHPDRYIECNVTSGYGYNIRWSNGSYASNISGLTKDEYNGIYIKSDTSKAYAMFLASPAAYSNNTIMYARSTSYVGYIQYNSSNYGFRPVVCLKQGTKLMDNGDNTYSIKEPIIANLEYKEAEGIVEIQVRYTENGIARIEDKDGNEINFINENGIIKAKTPTIGGKNHFIFTIIDNKGNKKKLEETLILPIYATLYTDGTLAFTSTDRILEGKTVSKKYGDISKEKCVINSNNTIISTLPWYNQEKNIKSANIVDEISPIYTNHWFWCCVNLTNIENINNLDTSNVTDMRDMFNSCSKLVKLDVTNFNTSNVTDMQSMFAACSSLTELDISNFDTSNVADMNTMFYNCSKLTKLNVSNFDTSNVTNMEHMFGMCSSLIELNLNNFITNNVTNMQYMFYECSGLSELDLSNFDVGKVNNMSCMFYYCTNLKTIYVGENWRNVSGDMFIGCGTSSVTKK